MTMAANPSVHVFTSARITSMCSLSVDTQQSSQRKIRNIESDLVSPSASKTILPTKKTPTPYIPAMKRPPQGATAHIRES